MVCHEDSRHVKLHGWKDARLLASNLGLSIERKAIGKMRGIVCFELEES